MIRFVLFLFTLLSAFSVEAVSKSKEIESIDSQLQQLEDMKRGYESKALRHESQAEYLQFDQQALLETRRHLQLAEENRQKAELVQQRIDQLKARRAELE